MNVSKVEQDIKENIEELKVLIKDFEEKGDKSESALRRVIDVINIKFMEQYIGHEDYVLDIVENKMNELQLSDSIDKVIDEFSIHWREYQENWTPEFWKIYEELRKDDQNSKNIMTARVRKFKSLYIDK